MTEKNIDRTSSSGVLSRCVSMRPLISFFIFAFLFSWIAWGFAFLFSEIEGHFISGLSGIFGLFVGFGPFFAAIVVLKSQKKRLRTWLKNIFRFKVKFWWYIIALAIPLIRFTIIEWIYLQLEGGTYIPFEMDLLFILIPLFLWGVLLGGGQEELGWRGFGLPLLQTKFSPFISSLILGVMHAFWHLPMAIIPGTYQSNGSFVLYIIFVLGITFFYTWIYNCTKSVVIAMLFHGAINTLPVFAILPTFNYETMEMPQIPLSLQVPEALVAILGAIVIIIISAKKIKWFKNIKVTTRKEEK